MINSDAIMKMKLDEVDLLKREAESAEDELTKALRNRPNIDAVDGDEAQK